jgi:hypothetical protein
MGFLGSCLFSNHQKVLIWLKISSGQKMKAYTNLPSGLKLVVNILIYTQSIL